MMSPSRRIFAAVFVCAAVAPTAGACGADDRAPYVDSRDAEAAPPLDLFEGGVEPSSPPALPPAPVDVVITADNAYAFGWGDEAKITTLYENAPARTSSEIFDCPIGTGPEAYVVPADEALPGAWLYVVSWADYTTSQGVIAQFKHRGGDAIYTGAGEWQACATGRPYPDNLTRPDKQTINDEIARCNAGSGDPARTSAGWVGPTAAITPNAQGRVAFGQDNMSDIDLRPSPGYVFPPVCKRDVTHGGQGIDGQARWMWYAPPGFAGNPFLATGDNDTRTFLVFRFPTSALPPPKLPK